MDGVKLEVGAVCPTQNCLKKSCFFLVSHVAQEGFIRTWAEQLLKAGCREFHFWGDKEDANRNCKNTTFITRNA